MIFIRSRCAACDVQLQGYLSALPIRRGPGAGEPSTTDAPSEKPNKRRQRKLHKNQPAFDLAAELQRTMGVDVTAIDGVDVMTTQVILSELGPDLSSSFPSESHFTSWLELVPRRDISGGKVIRQKSRKSNNRVANALRMAAQSLWRSDSYLGARYRHLKARLGGAESRQGNGALFGMPDLSAAHEGQSVCGPWRCSLSKPSERNESCSDCDGKLPNSECSW